jgi:regulator of sigma E protease
MAEVFSAVFWGIVTFSILVVLHEGGHFLAARAFGVRVHEFMIGLPGPALRWRAKETTYGLTAIPLGGYVRIAGMEPGPEERLLLPALSAVRERGMATPETLAPLIDTDVPHAEDILRILTDWGALDRPDRKKDEYVPAASIDSGLSSEEVFARVRARTFRGLPTWKRVTVLSMGVVVNLATAILVFTIVLSAFPFYWPTLQVDRLSPEGGAAAAGIVAGDRIVSVDGRKLSGWTDLASTIAAFQRGDHIDVAIERAGAGLSIPVTLGRNPDSGRGFLGVQPVFVKARLSVPRAFEESLGLTRDVFKAIGKFFNPRTFEASLQGARSIVGVSVEVSNAARSGILDYATIVALLSLSLGAMNILPIPPLDGGKIALELVERLAGRPLPRSVTLGFSAVGAAMLFALIGYLMYADTVRYIIHG